MLNKILYPHSESKSLFTSFEKLLGDLPPPGLVSNVLVDIRRGAVIFPLFLLFPGTEITYIVSLVELPAQIV